MTIAVARPNLIAATVLNDIGPVGEPLGLMRIKAYVGKLPAPATGATRSGPSSRR